MIKIHKGTEPKTLTKYRAEISKENREDENIYDDFPEKTKEGCESKEKENLRWQLLEEQGYVCCYCLSQISCKDSKIEHFKPQSEHRDKQIDYKNLFVSCLGGSKRSSYCDTAKGDQELSSVDLLTHIEKRIYYGKTGRVMSNEQLLEDDINRILNLNSSILIKNRKQTYSDLICKMRKEKFSGTWSKPYVQTILNKYKQKGKNGKYAPYYGMLIYFLQRRINKL